MKIYLIGSLRNVAVRDFAALLRSNDFEVFDDWHAAGEKADEEWQRYETERGRNYFQALEGHAARHTFEYDKKHITDSDAVVLVSPAGKSAHLELGYARGLGKPGYILLLEEPERWDVMYRFASKVVSSFAELILELRKVRHDLDISTPTSALGSGGGGTGSAPRISVQKAPWLVPAEPGVVPTLAGDSVVHNIPPGHSSLNVFD